MSQFDAAIGMSADTLNQGLSGLYQNTQAQQQLFQGTKTGTVLSQQYTAVWAAQQAPEFTLAPPTQQVWSTSVDSSGVNPTTPIPTENVFQLNFPAFQVQYTLGTAPTLKATAQVIVIAQMSITNNQASFTPLTIWIDETNLSGWNKIILNIILGEIITQIQPMLSGLNIPTLAFSKYGITIAMSPPVGSISNGYLYLATSLGATSTPDITGVTWPTDGLFVLVSAALIEQIATQGATAHLNGYQATGSGDYKSIMDYNYTAEINSISSITSNSTDMTQISGDVSFGFTATLKPLGAGGPCAIGAATSSM